MINIREMWCNQKPVGNIIVKTRIDEIHHLKCYAATNHITGQHSYVMGLAKDVSIPELKNYKFKGVAMFLVKLDEVNELNIYLIDNELMDVFSLFIQDILKSIALSITEKDALIATLNVVSKWKRLFDKIQFDGLTIEQQKGLIGEMLFLNYLFDNKENTSDILQSWTGPNFDDKDFMFGSKGVEIKMTSSKYPKISITNERQLDTDNLNQLFLVLYVAEEVKDNGFTLNSIIKTVSGKINTSEELAFFKERLLLVGYHDEHRGHYNRMYSLKNTFCFNVTPDFPRIVKEQLPMGVYNTSYSIELYAVEQFKISMEQMLIKI